MSCALRTAESKGRTVGLVAKAWDLADAYKQVPLSDEAFLMDSFFAVFNPSKGKPELSTEGTAIWVNSISHSVPQDGKRALENWHQVVELDVVFIL